MKKMISLFLALIISVSVILPVSARADDFPLNWFDLLDFTTINGAYNDFSYGTSRTLTIPMPRYMRVVQVDILLSHTNGTAPDKVEVSADGTTWKELEIYRISDGITRVFGQCGNSFYSDMRLRFTRSSSVTSYVDVKSFKIYTLPTTFIPLTGTITLNSANYSDNVAVGTLEVVPAVSEYPIWKQSYELKTSLSNAYSCDYVTLTGYVKKATIESVRVTYGVDPVPLEISFIDAESGATWDGSGTGVYHEVSSFGYYYFTITADLRNVDRASKSRVEIVFTGNYNTYEGMQLKLDSLKGFVSSADESDAWAWNRFTSFITEKFSALGSSISTGFSNVSTWISNQTTTLNSGLTNVRTTLNTALTNVRSAINTGFTNVGNWFTEQTDSLLVKLASLEGSVQQGFFHVGEWFDQYFGVKDEESIDDLNQNSGSISEGAADIHEFEQSQQDTLNTGFATIQNAVSFTGFANALVFVQRYANMTVNGISDYTIVFTLPLFLGLFFYLCSRVPGVTRWKSRPPKSKGGGNP